MPRKSREEWKIYENVFDKFTISVLIKLIKQKHLDGIIGPVKVGKESNIFSAKKGEGKVIIKIYRLHSCNFNRMYDYIKQDPRYVNLKKQRRKVIFAWVQREYRNLLKARQAGASVPSPLANSFNVLVLEFIGGKKPAPQLKDCLPKDKGEFFELIVEYMNKLYHGAGIIHGDLSEYNILNFRGRPVLIDFSQGTSVKSPNAQELLDRDIRNMCKFFQRHGLAADENKIKKRILKKRT